MPRRIHCLPRRIHCLRIHCLPRRIQCLRIHCLPRRIHCLRIHCLPRRIQCLRIHCLPRRIQCLRIHCLPRRIHCLLRRIHNRRIHCLPRRMHCHHFPTSSLHPGSRNRHPQRPWQSPNKQDPETPKKSRSVSFQHVLNVIRPSSRPSSPVPQETNETEEEDAIPPTGEDTSSDRSEEGPQRPCAAQRLRLLRPRPPLSRIPRGRRSFPQGPFLPQIRRVRTMCDAWNRGSIPCIDDVRV